MTCKVVGTSVPRKDGIEKATGKAQFVADMKVPGCWEGAVIGSPVPHGILKGFEKDPSFDWSKVVFLTAKDLKGKNFVHMVRDDFPILAEEKVTYATQGVALLAAPDEATLKAALKAVKPIIEPLTPVLSIEDSLAKVAIVWGEDNILDEYKIDRGDLEKGFAEADVIVEGTYRTGLHEHLYLETQGMMAIPHEDGTLEVVGSMQCPDDVHGALVQSLGWEPERIRVRQAATGGGFGGKEDFPSAIALWVANLSLACGKPVRLIYDRSDDLKGTPKRHPSRTRIKAGVKKDGTLTALQIEFIMDGGAFTTMSRVVQQRGTLHAHGCYRVPNVSIHSLSVATNMVPSGAYRGFGAPQSIFAMERHMDKIAQVLGMDPLDVRLKNVLEVGDVMPCGQVLKESVHAKEALLRAAELSDYRRKREEYAKMTGRVRRGIGISLAMHGGGFTGAGETNMGTIVKIEFDGEIFKVHASSTDMGQGIATVHPMIAAEALHVPYEAVESPRPDTWVTPNSGPTVASRSTMYVGRVVQEAAKNMLKELEEFLKGKHGEASFKDGVFVTNAGEISVLDAAKACRSERGKLEVFGTLPPGCTGEWNQEAFRGEAYKAYSWIAQAIEVDVDTDTFEVQPVKATVVAEIGKAIHPVMVEGQIHGGLLQAIGWSHIEDMTLTPEGHISAEHLNAYLIPTTLDTPEWKVEVLEPASCPVGPHGAKGLGELPMDGGAPAFLAAVQHAVGVFGTEVPLTGEKLFKLLEEKGC
jgi:CO/xanthine dehydrogenase Mo-binding subunit